MHWNGMMFHPTFTAAPGTAELTATFEVYLVDGNSGEEIANSGTGPFTLTWTNASDGRPQLRIDHGLVISWPSSATNYFLESTTGISGSWTAVTNAPVVEGDRSSVQLAPAQAQQTFRMKVVE
jgi:hypothetical protein